MNRYFAATGKRKTSIAKVRLTKGKGVVVVNDRPMKDFFVIDIQREAVMAPLRAVGMEKDYDVSVVVRGGGTTGQSEAIRHGVSRALLEIDPLLRTTLKKAGFLTRDPRVKERKKPGLHRARRGPQFSKR